MTAATITRDAFTHLLSIFYSDESATRVVASVSPSTRSLIKATLATARVADSRIDLTMLQSNAGDTTTAHFRDQEDQNGRRDSSQINPQPDGRLPGHLHAFAQRLSGLRVRQELVSVLLRARDARSEIFRPSLGRMGESEAQRARIVEAGFGSRGAQRDVRKSADFHEHGDRPISGRRGAAETHARDSRGVRGERRFRISGRADALALDRTRH